MRVDRSALISPRTFRAKLRPPKRTLWLGCVVRSFEIHQSKANGRPYARIQFENCPFVAIWSEYQHDQFLTVCRERDVEPPANELAPGTTVNVDVKWVLDPYLPAREPRLFPRPWIDFSSVVQANLADAPVIQ